MELHCVVQLRCGTAENVNFTLNKTAVFHYGKTRHRKRSSSVIIIQVTKPSARLGPRILLISTMSTLRTIQATRFLPPGLKRP